MEDNNYFNLFQEFLISKKIRNYYEMPNEVIGPIRSSLLITQIKNYSKLRKKRNEVYQKLKNKLPLSTWHEDLNNKHSAIKIKANAININSAENITKNLRRNGIRAGNFNWPNLIGKANKKSHPFSYQASSYWIDIPCHQNLEDKDIHLLCSIIKKALNQNLLR